MGESVWSEMDRALGPVAMLSLQRRGLLPQPGQGVAALPDRAVMADRVAGALVGVAVGNALGRMAERHRRSSGEVGYLPAEALARLALAGRNGRVRAEAQELVLATEALLDGGLRAPALLSDRLVATVAQLRSPGRAVVEAMRRRLAGAPWFEAAVDSYGNGAVVRAVAAGLVVADDPVRRPVVAGLDAVVTHAHPAAVAASAVVADVVAALVTRPGDALPPWPTSPDALVGAALADAGRFHGRPVRQGLDRLGFGPEAPSTVAVALTCLWSTPDPVQALALAASVPGDADTIAALTGALVGAAWGLSRLPLHWTSGVELGAPLRALAARVVGRLVPVASTAHLWFLLDRSGSMDAIAGAVVEGFDGFFAEQATVGGDAVATVVQFDSEDPHEVLLDGVPVPQVPRLQGYRPRGGTPLYDALSDLLDRAEAAAGDGADQLVVVLTDGLENASHRATRDDVFGRVRGLQERGWTFVFLGANQDSYAEGGHLGMAAGNTSNYWADDAGVDRAWRGMSRATREWRAKDRAARHRDRDEFWGGVKEAEQR
jgi:ADP-ribosylglycohydrolase